MRRGAWRGASSTSTFPTPEPAFDSSLKEEAQADLFGYEPTSPYPFAPGAKAGGTSELAARLNDSSAKDRRAEAYASFVNDGPGTADEIAERLGRSVLSVRPRCAELHALKLIVPTGERRPSSTGMPSTVWRAAAGAR
jgi:hypothetical protein